MKTDHVTTPLLPGAVSLNLKTGAEVARKLEEAGSEVIGVYGNGRRLVLLIAKPPAFVHGHCKNRHPNGMAGYTRVYAAPYHGVQIEWMVDEPAISQVVGHA